MDLTETLIQFRTEWNTYDGNTRLQVEWIDVYDATPGRSVKKLDANELKSLDAQYAQMLGASSTKAAPAKAGKVTKAGVKSTQNRGPVTNKNTKKTIKEENTIEAPVEENTQAPPGPPVSPTVAKEAENAVSGSCTKDEAWKAVLDLKKKDVGDEALANIWLGAIKDAAPGIEQEDVTTEQWWVVRMKVLEQVSSV
ncbi:hypothetical protein LCGC14_2640750 [marine sediment metagenome]|uniref:Uncharacterized protein n=1 Tax=marine sediment metagenome TaxID=412755 RepID=A0A0F8ZXH3_9ZZZZ